MIYHDKVRLKPNHVLFKIFRICFGEQGILRTQNILKQLQDLGIIIENEYLFLLLHIYKLAAGADSMLRLIRLRCASARN